MNKIRLLPVLVFGLMSLLGIKLLGIAFDTPSGKPVASVETTTGERLAKVIERAREGVIDDEILTGSTGGKPKETKKEDPAKPDANKPMDSAKAAEAAAVEAQKAKIRSEPEGVRLPAPPVTQAEGQRSSSPTERELLERLKSRRAAIDAQDRDLEMRDALLRATERKLDEKIGLLRSLESQGETQATPKNDAKMRYKPLVTMYESMKPKEAARVFDKLDIAILLDLVGHMNPRKMSEILAVMEPGAAGKLTVALARQAAQGPAQTAEAGLSPDAELPRLAAQPPRR